MVLVSTFISNSVLYVTGRQGLDAIIWTDNDNTFSGPKNCT